MSRIYFHSRHGEAAVRGWERASFGVMTDDVCEMWLLPKYPDAEETAAIRELFSIPHGYREMSTFLRAHWAPWFTVA